MASASALELSLRIRAATEGLDNISNLINEIRELGGDTEELESRLGELSTEFNRLAQQKELIDRFNGIRQSVTDIAKQFDDAKAKVRALAAELNATANPSEKLRQAFKDATSDANALQRQLDGQRRTLEATSRELRVAGVDTSTLISEQRRLETTLASVRGRIDAESDSIRKQSDSLKSAKQASDEASIATDRLKQALLAVGLGVAASRVIELADQYKTIEGRLKQATAGQEEFASAFSDVMDIAKSSFSDLESVGKLYERLAVNAGQLALNSKEVADITGVLAKSLKIGGATAEESASAITQLTQALGSGVLRGEEFNAVFEASSYTMQQLAEGIGVPIGQLRKLAESGQLTADVVTKALLKQKDAVDAAFKNLPVTTGYALSQLATQLQGYIGELDKSIGITSTAAAGIGILGDNIAAASNFVLAAVAAGGIAKLTTLLGGLSAGSSAAALATRGLSAAISALKSPLGIGAVVGLLAALVTHFSTAKQRAEEFSASIRERIDELGKLSAAELAYLRRSQEEVIKKSESDRAASEQTIASIKQQIARLQELGPELDSVFRRMGEHVGVAEELKDAQDRLALAEAEAGKQARLLADNKEALVKVDNAMIALSTPLAQGIYSVEKSYLAQRAELDKLIVSGKERSALANSEIELTRQIADSETLLAKTIGTEAEIRKSAITVLREQADATNSVVSSQEEERNNALALIALLEKELAARKNDAEQRKAALSLAESTDSARVDELNSTKSLIAELEQQRVKLGSLTEAQKTELDLLYKKSDAQRSAVENTGNAVLQRQKEIEATAQQITNIQDEITGIRLSASEKERAITVAEQSILTSEAESAALAGVAEGHRLAGQQMALTSQQLSSFAEIAKSSTSTLLSLQDAYLRGEITQSQLNAAIVAATEVQSTYKTALEETITRVQEQQVSSDRLRESIEREYDVRLAQNTALQAAAKARGDENAQIELSIERKRIEAEQLEATAAAMTKQLPILEEQVRLKKLQAQADQEITIEEQAQIAVLENSVEQRKTDIELTKLSAEAKRSEAAAARSAAQAAEDQSKANTELTAKSSERAVSENAATEAIMLGAESYDRLTDSMKRSYAAQVQLLSSGRDLRINSENIIEYFREIDTAAKSEEAFADTINSAVDALDDQSASSFHAKRQLEVLSRSAFDYGDAITSAGKQAIDTLRRIREEQAEALSDLREFIADANEDFAAQEQLTHEANMARINELASASTETERLRAAAEAAEVGRHNREIARIKAEAAEKLKAEQDTSALTQSAKDVYSSFQKIDTVSFENLSTKLYGIMSSLDTLQEKANTLRGTL